MSSVVRQVQVGVGRPGASGEVRDRLVGSAGLRCGESPAPELDVHRRPQLGGVQRPGEDGDEPVDEPLRCIRDGESTQPVDALGPGSVATPPDDPIARREAARAATAERSRDLRVAHRVLERRRTRCFVDRVARPTWRTSETAPVVVEGQRAVSEDPGIVLAAEVAPTGVDGIADDAELGQCGRRRGCSSPQLPHHAFTDHRAGGGTDVDVDLVESVEMPERQDEGVAVARVLDRVPVVHVVRAARGRSGRDDLRVPLRIHLGDRNVVHDVPRLHGHAERVHLFDDVVEHGGAHRTAQLREVLARHVLVDDHDVVPAGEQQEVVRVGAEAAHRPHQRPIELALLEAPVDQRRDVAVREEGGEVRRRLGRPPDRDAVGVEDRRVGAQGAERRQFERRRHVVLRTGRAGV